MCEESCIKSFPAIICNKVGLDLECVVKKRRDLLIILDQMLSAVPAASMWILLVAVAHARNGLRAFAPVGPAAGRPALHRGAPADRARSEFAPPGVVGPPVGSPPAG